MDSKVVLIASSLVISCFICTLGDLHTEWPVTVFEELRGHYPCFCTFTDMVFKWEDGKFYYKHDLDLHSKSLRSDIWDLKHDPNLNNVQCDEYYDIGYVFTIYYRARSSNYFHLFVDLVIPLFNEVYHKKSLQDVASKKKLFMPTVETIRLQKLNWDTDAFIPPQEDKYWNEIARFIAGSHVYKPLDRRFLNEKKNVCFKQVKFGTPSVDKTDKQLITSMIKNIQDYLKIERKPFLKHRVGIISRSNRRKIINEKELLEVVRPLADVELVEFSGKTFDAQVRMMQDFTVLVGVNGAGLMNCIFVPSYSTCVQLVPYQAGLNYVAFGNLLKLRGPYLEWHNKHEDLNVAQPGDDYRNRGDTLVHVEEFKELIKKALDKSDSALKRQKNHEEL